MTDNELILINDEGLRRCCLESVSLYTQTKSKELNNIQPKSGEIFECKLCGEEMELVEEKEFLCWQKKLFS